MDFLLEIFLFGCIIFLVFYAFRIKQKEFHANSLSKENSFLKEQLTQKESDFNLREKNLQNTIHNLQFSFELEQKSIQDQTLELKTKEKKLLDDYSDLEAKLIEETETRKKVFSQKKSSEVRLGCIAETLAPFLDQFEFDPEDCTFLGKPIDYISFGKDNITFIEIKSGKSQLNSRQRQIRDQIKDKLVAWKEVRIQ